MSYLNWRAGLFTYEVVTGTVFVTQRLEVAAVHASITPVRYPNPNIDLDATVPAIQPQYESESAEVPRNRQKSRCVSIMTRRFANNT